jgi:hypothetical protein
MRPGDARQPVPEGIPHLPGAVETVFGLERHRAVHQRDQGRIEVGRDPLEGRNTEGRRHVAGQQMMHCGADRIQIGAGIGVSLDLLEGRVVEGGHLGLGGPVRLLEHARDAEIDELHPAALPLADDVAGLDVAVEHRGSEAVEVDEHLEHLEHGLDHSARIQRPRGAQLLLEGLPRDVVHHQVASALLLEGVADPRDAGVGEGGEEGHLFAELAPYQGGGLRVEVGVEKTLDGARAASLVTIPGLVHGAKAADGDGANNLVALREEGSHRQFHGQAP